MGVRKVKLAGHTMATPEFDVFEALRFFKKLGLDGAEIVVQTGYESGIPLSGACGRRRTPWGSP